MSDPWKAKDGVVHIIGRHNDSMMVRTVYGLCGLMLREWQYDPPVKGLPPGPRMQPNTDEAPTCLWCVARD